MFFGVHGDPEKSREVCEVLDDKRSPRTSETTNLVEGSVQNIGIGARYMCQLQVLFARSRSLKLSPGGGRIS